MNNYRSGVNKKTSFWLLTSDRSFSKKKRFGEVGSIPVDPGISRFFLVWGYKNYVPELLAEEESPGCLVTADDV